VSQTNRCIYCTEVKPLNEFSEEHIIPQFLGGTSECPASVTNDVCQRCNSLFGRFVDAPVARGYFLRSIEQGSWRGCFDFNESTGNVYALTYFGKSRELEFGDNEEIEVWLCPDGGTAWHVHTKQAEDFSALAGGDPVLRRKDQSSRVYNFLASQHPYWAFSNFKSVQAHFTEEPIFHGTDTDIEGQLEQGRTKGKFCQKDSAALQERDRILALLDERRPLDHLIQMDLLFDVRFLAKLAVAFGFNILGDDFGNLRYTEMLRKLLWTRRANLETVQHQVRMKAYFNGLQDYSFRYISVPLSFVFLVKAFKEGVVLGIVFPSGHYAQVSITDSTIDSDAELLGSKVKDHVFVSIPQLSKTIGPIDLPRFIAWKLGSHKIVELDDIAGRLTDRSAMPRLR